MDMEPIADPPEAPATDNVEKPDISARIVFILHRLGPAGPLAVLAASMPAIGGFLMLGSIKWFAPWLRTHQLSGILICIFVYAVLGGFALLPSYAHSVLCG